MGMTEKQKQAYDRAKHGQRFGGSPQEQQSTHRPNQATERPQSQPEQAQGSMTALAAHQGFEQIAGALSRSSDNRLNSLAGAVVQSRKAQVERFCDFLEKAETGELDLALIGAELQRRKERKADMPGGFDLDSPGFGVDLDATVDCVGLLAGFGTAKAIAGV